VAPSSVLVAPGLRTLPRAIGWRSRAGLALAIVIGQPSLWLLGALGFVLRGGIVVLTLPIVVLPTLVEARLMLGANLGSDGFAPAFLAALAVLLLLLCIPLVGAMLLIARAEVDAFETLLREPEAAELRHGDPRWPEPGWPEPGRRRRLVGQIFAIQLGALLALAFASIPLLGALYTSVAAQILRPTGTGDIYLRVVADVQQPLFALAAVIVLVEMLSALLTRARLLKTYGLGAGIGQLPLLRRPLAVIGTGLASWLITLAAAAPSLWLIGLTWQQARSTYMSLGATADAEKLAGVAVVTASLALAFIVGLLLTGVAAAIRAALWTAESLQ
jgi:hypothetical protein